MSALPMVRDSRVRRVAIVDDSNLLELAEWLDLRQADDRSAALMLERR